MHGKNIIKSVFFLTLSLAIPVTVHAQADQTLERRMKVLEAALFETQRTVTSQQQQIKALQDKVKRMQLSAAFTQNIGGFMIKVEEGEINGLRGPHVIFEGVNVHIRSGSGSTDDDHELTGLGNLVIGYNEAPPFDFEAGDRGGSHNLVIGREQRFMSFGGLVSGFRNTISGEEATVTGGGFIVASGAQSSVSGGVNSTAKYPDGSSEPFSRECAMIYQGISVAKMCQNIWSGT